MDKKQIKQFCNVFFIKESEMYKFLSKAPEYFDSEDANYYLEVIGDIIKKSTLTGDKIIDFLNNHYIDLGLRNVNFGLFMEWMKDLCNTGVSASIAGERLREELNDKGII
jgi:hypothetical protein